MFRAQAFIQIRFIPKILDVIIHLSRSGTRYNAYLLSLRFHRWLHHWICLQVSDCMILAFPFLYIIMTKWMMVKWCDEKRLGYSKFCVTVAVAVVVIGAVFYFLTSGPSNPLFSAIHCFINSADQAPRPILCLCKLDAASWLLMRTLWSEEHDFDD